MDIDKAKALALIGQGPKNALIFGSGHDLYSLKDYLRWGSVIDLKESDIKDLEVRHYSDGTMKGTISIDGQPVEYMDAIDNKDMLMWMANQLDMDISEHNWISGRGTWARAVTASIYEKLADIAEITEEEATELRTQGYKEEKIYQEVNGIKDADEEE